MKTKNWPRLTSYAGDNLNQISLPLGGIGTGTIGFGGRGQFTDFEISNRPSKGFRPNLASFVLRTESDKIINARVLEGPLPDHAFEGAIGSAAPNHGLPRFEQAEFHATYPFGEVVLTDPVAPRTTIQTFNPLVPGDVAASSIPVAIIRFTIENPGPSTMRASIAASMENFIGLPGAETEGASFINEYLNSGDLHAIRMTANGLAEGAEFDGSFVFASDLPGVTTDHSHRLSWGDSLWGGGLLDFWDDFVDDGRVDHRSSTATRPTASLVTTIEVAPHSRESITFYYAWNFPNRKAWRSDNYGNTDVGQYTDSVVGNHYSELFPDPWGTVEFVKAEMKSLESRTLQWVNSVVSSSAPTEILEASLFNLSTLRSPTVFRTSSGEFYGWEGCYDNVGSCFGTCSHVWGYEFATCFLFREIAESFRRSQYLKATDQDGLMSFRVGLPVEESQTWGLAAADGQMASLVHLYLDWRMSGDIETLKTLWPAARRSLEFAWLEGSWDADGDGVMEGCQHNTMDVEYFGPNPQIQSWYLAALKAMTQLAKVLGEQDFASQCEGLFEKGSEWTDRNLFNGEYYIQEIRPVPKGALTRAGLKLDSALIDPHNPTYQLGDGVLIDQLVGQYASRLVGLGDVLGRKNVSKTLDTIFQNNFKTTQSGHFNNMRSYVLGDEPGVLMCSYPLKGRGLRPFPYFAEVMTGYEYTLAVGHIQDGSRETARTIISAIRSRYTGRRRNPFDEAECGHHYARALASWSSFVAWAGFEWDANLQTMKFGLSEPNSRMFWSVGNAMGEIRTGENGSLGTVTLEIFHGTIEISQLLLSDQLFNINSTLNAGEVVSCIADSPMSESGLSMSQNAEPGNS